MREIINKALMLSILSVLFTVPYFHYLLFEAPRAHTLPTVSNPMTLLMAELLLLFIICFLSSIIGLTFSERVGLEGFGEPLDWLRSLPILFLFGILMTGISYVLFDRQFIRISPVSYPDKWIYVITLPLKGAFTDEIILRYCLVTLFVGALRRKPAAVALVSAFASVLTVKYFNYVGLGWDSGSVFFVQMILAFAANFLLGWVYVTRGLLQTMTLKFIFGLKYIVIWWVKTI
jgi:hypothetical protein